MTGYNIVHGVSTISQTLNMVISSQFHTFIEMSAWEIGKLHTEQPSVNIVDYKIDVKINGFMPERLESSTTVLLPCKIAANISGFIITV